MAPKMQKKKIKTRISSKKDTAELVQTVVKVLRTAEKEERKNTGIQSFKTDNRDDDSLAALRRDMQKMQQQFDDRIDRIEDKVSSLRVFADDTRRSVSEQSKTLDDRLDQLARAVNESFEKESKKNVKLVKTVYKEHGEEISSIKDSANAMFEETTDKVQLLNADVEFLAKDISRVKDAVDEL